MIKKILTFYKKYTIMNSSFYNRYNGKIKRSIAMFSFIVMVFCVLSFPFESFAQEEGQLASKSVVIEVNIAQKKASLSGYPPSQAPIRYYNVLDAVRGEYNATVYSTSGEVLGYFIIEDFPPVVCDYTGWV